MAHRVVNRSPDFLTFFRRSKYARFPRTLGPRVGRADSPWPPASRTSVTISAVLNGRPALRIASKIIRPSSPCLNSLIRLGSLLFGMESVWIEGSSSFSVASTWISMSLRCRSWRSSWTISEAIVARLFLRALSAYRSPLLLDSSLMPTYLGAEGIHF